MVADRHSHRQHTTHRSTTSSEVDAQIGRYQRHRQRERQERRARERRSIRKTEADVIIRTALTWVPYGGVPEDDIFQMFGMSRSRFIETLWHTVRSVNPEEDTIDQLARVYLDPRLRRNLPAFPPPAVNRTQFDRN